MKAKKVAAVALTAAMTVSMAASVNVFAADGYDPADFKSDKDSSEWTIAVVTKDNTANWFKRMEVGVNEFGEETGINVIQKGPANADAASQVQVIDDMINQGVDALCTFLIKFTELYGPLSLPFLYFFINFISSLFPQAL